MKHNQACKNKPIFIVGPGRSGSTLLRLMLNMHPNIVITSEAAFIYRLWNCINKISLDYEKKFDYLWEKTRKSPSFQDFKLDISDEEFANAVYAVSEKDHKYDKFITALHEVHMQINGKTRWGNKTPRLGNYLREIDYLFPGSNIIGMIRDGRAVALSYFERQPLEEDPRKKLPSLPNLSTNSGGQLRLSLLPLAVRWIDYLRPMRKSGHLLRDSLYTEVYFENLINDPERELKRICRFINEDYSPDMLNYFKDAYAKIPQTKRRFHTNTKFPVDASRADHWKEEISPAETHAIELVIGDDLVRSGYQLISPQLNVADQDYILQKIHEHLPEITRRFNI